MKTSSSLLLKFALFCICFCTTSLSAFAVSLNFQLVDQFANPVNAPANVDINCSLFSGMGSSFTATIVQGQSSISVDKPTGNSYGCSLSANAVSGYLNSTNQKSITVGSSASTTKFALRQKDGQLTVSMIANDTGLALAPGTGASLSCSDNATGEISVSSNFGSGASSVTLDVSKNTIWRCQVQNVNGYNTYGYFNVSVGSSGIGTYTYTALRLDSQIRLNFVDSNNQSVAVPAGSYTMYCSSTEYGSQVYVEDTFNSNGTDTFFTMNLVGGHEYTCEGDLYPIRAPYITASVSAASMTNANYKIYIPTEAVTFNLTSNAAPYTIDAGSPNAEILCEAPYGTIIAGEYSDQIGVGNSSSVFNLIPGFTYSCRPRFIQGLGLSTPAQVVVTAGTTPAVNIALEPFDATLAIRFQDLSGNLVAAATSNTVSCSRSLSGSSEFLFPYNATSTGINGLVNGGQTYYCDTSFGGALASYVHSSFLGVTAQPNQTINYPIYLSPRNATLRVAFQKEDGTALTTLPGCSAEIQSQDNRFPDSSMGDLDQNGIVDVSLPSSIPYLPNVYCDDDDSDNAYSGFYTATDGERYLRPLPEVENIITLTPSETKQVAIKAKTPNAAIAITVQSDASPTQPVSGVSVSAISYPIAAGASSYYISGKTDANGQVVLPLLGGLKWIFQTQELNGSPAYMTSEQVRQEIKVGDSLNLTLTAPVVTTSLNVTTTTSLALEYDESYCYFYSPDSGAYGYSADQVRIATIKNMHVAKGRYKVGCLGWANRSGTTNVVNLTAAEQTITISDSEPERNLTFDLIEGVPNIAFEELFDPAQEKKLTTQGVSVTIPAGAIADASAKLVLKNRAQIAPDKDGLPLFFLDLAVEGTNGSHPLLRQNGTIALSAQINKGYSAELRKLSNGSWIKTEATLLSADESEVSPLDLSTSGDSETITLQGEFNQSETFGIFLGAALPTPTPTVAPTLSPTPIGVTPKKPKKFTVSSIKPGIIRAAWHASKTADSYELKIYKRTLKHGRLISKLVRALSPAGNSHGANIKRLKNGTYSFVLAAVENGIRGQASKVVFTFNNE